MCSCACVTLVLIFEPDTFVKASTNADKKAQEVELQILRQLRAESAEKLDELHKGKREAEHQVMMLQQQLADLAGGAEIGEKAVTEELANVQHKLRQSSADLQAESDKLVAAETVVMNLEIELEKLRPKASALETLMTKYNDLELKYSQLDSKHKETAEAAEGLERAMTSAQQQVEHLQKDKCMLEAELAEHHKQVSVLFRHALCEMMAARGYRVCIQHP